MVRMALRVSTDTWKVEEVDEASLFCSVCGFIDCVCTVRKEHEEGCRFRTSMECPIGIECDHGYDVCPVCDPCTCKS